MKFYREEVLCEELLSDALSTLHIDGKDNNYVNGLCCLGQMVLSRKGWKILLTHIPQIVFLPPRIFLKINTSY